MIQLDVNCAEVGTVVIFATVALGHGPLDRRLTRAISHCYAGTAVEIIAGPNRWRSRSTWFS